MEVPRLLSDLPALEVVEEEFVLMTVLKGEIYSSSVWSAYRRGVPVAVKRFAAPPMPGDDDESVLLQELLCLGKPEMLHPCVMSCLEAFSREGCLWVVTDLMAVSLSSVLSERPRLDERCAASVFRNLAEGLAFVHAMGWSHLSVTSDNVLLSFAGTAKLCNLGSALRKETARKKVLRGSRGTSYWHAPEMISGDYGALSPACDVWALGVLAYEMVVGEPPYVELSPLAVMKKIATEGMPEMGLEYGGEVRDVVRLCCSGIPLMRPTCAQLLGHPFAANGALGCWDLAVIVEEVVRVTKTE